MNVTAGETCRKLLLSGGGWRGDLFRGVLSCSPFSFSPGRVLGLDPARWAPPVYSCMSLAPGGLRQRAPAGPELSRWLISTGTRAAPSAPTHCVPHPPPQLPDQAGFASSHPAVPGVAPPSLVMQPQSAVAGPGESCPSRLRRCHCCRTGRGRCAGEQGAKGSAGSAGGGGDREEKPRIRKAASRARTQKSRSVVCVQEQYPSWAPRPTWCVHSGPCPPACLRGNTNLGAGQGRVGPGRGRGQRGSAPGRGQQERGRGSENGGGAAGTKGTVGPRRGLCGAGPGHSGQEPRRLLSRTVSRVPGALYLLPALPGLPPPSAALTPPPAPRFWRPRLCVPGWGCQAAVLGGRPGGRGSR